MKLGDILTLQRGNTYKGSLLGLPGPFLLGLASIKPNGGFRDDSLKTYGGESSEKLLLKPGDLYVSLKDVTQSADLLGAVSRVPKHIDVGRLTQDTVKLIFKDKAISPSYIYWLLRTPDYREYCRARSTGTTNLGLSRDDFFDFPVPEPTAYRLNLVNLLEDVESKIEVNRRMNATLESMSRAVFREMIKNGEREERTIGDVVTIVGGSTPSTTNPVFWDDGEINWATPKDLAPLQSPFLLETNSWITELGLQDISSGLLPVGTVLLSSRAPIGYLAITQISVAINQGFIAIKCTDEVPNYFVLNWLKENMEEIIGRANGTTFLEISKSNFRPMKIIVPAPEKMKAFVEQVEPLYQKIVANLKESRTLGSLRDSLLPKLTRGEVRMKKA